MFKQHLEMIGRNESPSKKAKFWQSYVRSLKGSEDIRAQDSPTARSYRPLSTFAELPSYRSIYDDPIAPQDRITVPGYRYLPVHRETYGYSPRPIYNKDYNHRPTSVAWDPEKAWAEHIERMADIDRRYPSRYGLYLKDKPNMALGPLEYEPEDKPGRSSSVPPRAGSIPNHRAGSPFREMTMPRGRSPFRGSSPFRASSPLRGSSVDRLLDDLDVPSVFTRGLSPTPVKAHRWAPRPSEVAYNYDGLPMYTTFYRPYNSSRYTSPSVTSLPLFHRSPCSLRSTYLPPVTDRSPWYSRPYSYYDWL